MLLSWGYYKLSITLNKTITPKKMIKILERKNKHQLSLTKL